MSADEAAVIRLWKEKRGEIEPEDLSGNLIVQLGNATEDLNRNWYEKNTGRTVTDVQGWVRHPVNQVDVGDARRLGLRDSTPSSKPSSCCLGRSRKKRPPRSTWRSCSIICG